MARQSNPESFTMSVRVNVRDLAKAGRFLMEYGGNVPTGRGSIVGSALRTLAMLWEQRRREEGRSCDIEVFEAHRWLDERWPRIRGGDAMKASMQRGANAVVEAREKFMRGLEERLTEPVEMASEEEIREFDEMMKREAIKAGDFYGDMANLRKPEGKNLLYDPESLDVYTMGGKKVMGMKWNVETNSTEPDKEMMRKLGPNFNSGQEAEGRRSQEDE